MKAVIFDIDNCLADDSPRIPLIDWRPGLRPSQRYAAYHAACEADAPGNRELFRLWVATHLCEPVFLTGRPLVVRAETERWLRRHFGIVRPTLIMRNNDDERPSVAVKRDQLAALVEYGIGDIVAAYDDRPEIVQMYRDHKIDAWEVCLHNLDAYGPQRLLA